METIDLDVILDGTVLFQLGYKASNYANLPAAIAAISTTPGTLYIDSSQSVTDDLVIPETLSVVILKPGLLTISSGKTLTINGPFDAGIYQVFSGAGSVSFSGNKYLQEVYPEWWGAIADGITDCTISIQAAVDSFDSVCFSEGTYLSDTVTLNENNSLYGRGSLSIIKQNAITGSSYGTLYVNSGSSSTYIDNISIKDLQVLGNVAVDGFSQFQHLISLNGVSNVNIKNCLIKGFRGDGIYIGSGVTGGDERHNKNVKIENCTIDGVNKDNRNGISVIDCNNLIVQKCIFQNCTRADMPGAIDIEPDNNVFHIAKNIKVIGNSFYNIGGNVAIVSLVFNLATFTVQPELFVVAGNTFDDSTALCAVGFFNNAIYARPFNLSIIGNTSRIALFQGYTYLRGLSIIGNTMYKADCYFGYNSTDICNNMVFSGNVIYGNASGSGMVIRGADGVVINNNTFNYIVDYAIQIGHATDAVVTNCNISNNIFLNITGTGYAVLTNGGVSGASCVYKNNIGGAAHNFPAWLNDDCGVVINGTSAVSFNSATLPDSFPVGICTCIINGDTGVPSTGAYQGTLINYRFAWSGGAYEKFTYQHYYSANNSVDPDSFYIRKRNAGANTWTAWYKVTGV